MDFWDPDGLWVISSVLLSIWSHHQPLELFLLLPISLLCNSQCPFILLFFPLESLAVLPAQALQGEPESFQYPVGKWKYPGFLAAVGVSVVPFLACLDSPLHNCQGIPASLLFPAVWHSCPSTTSRFLGALATARAGSHVLGSEEHRQNLSRFLAPLLFYKFPKKVKIITPAVPGNPLVCGSLMQLHSRWEDLLRSVPPSPAPFAL